MKQFSCGDVVPGCGRVFSGDTDDEVLTAVTAHARIDHGLSTIPDSLLEQVRGHILLATR